MRPNNSLQGTCIKTATVVSAALFLGCFGNETSSFPPGLEPLEPSTAMAPAHTDADTYPEELTIVTGEEPRYHWVHARGYVHAPLEQVFDALGSPDVCVDRRGVDRYSVEHDVEPGYDHSFRIRNEVDDIVDVEFDVTWRVGIVEQDGAEPQTVAATWQKTWGTIFIDLLRGSLVARRVDPSVTELEMVEHLNAAMGGADPAAAFLRDLHRNIAARSRGEDLPSI